MRRSAAFVLLGAVSGFLFCAAAHAGRNPADFPLRVHIFSHNGTAHYAHSELDFSEGEGRANLYQNGQPTAIDYSYRCQDRLMNSVGYETYMARWKKQDRTLEILLPVMGKPNAAETCQLKVEMKPSMAYYKHNGLVNEEPADAFKKWMDAHQYDPEHGKDQPVAPAPAAKSEPAQQ